jgi:uncharacterized protein (AIM24 family)/Flp pilus assembly protein TadD
MAAEDGGVEVLDEEFLFHLSRGADLLAQGDPGGARAALERALKLRHDDVQALGLLGQALYRLGRYEDAAVPWQRLVDENPAEVGARVNLGLAFLKAKRWGDAAKHLEIALDLNPQHQKAMGYVGLALLQGGDPARARGWFASAGQDQMVARCDQLLASRRAAEPAPPFPPPSAPVEAIADAPVEAAPAPPSAEAPAEEPTASEHVWPSDDELAEAGPVPEPPPEPFADAAPVADAAPPDEQTTPPEEPSAEARQEEPASGPDEAALQVAEQAARRALDGPSEWGEAPGAIGLEGPTGAYDEGAGFEAAGLGPGPGPDDLGAAGASPSDEGGGERGEPSFAGDDQAPAARPDRTQLLYPTLDEGFPEPALGGEPEAAAWRAGGPAEAAGVPAPEVGPEAAQEPPGGLDVPVDVAEELEPTPAPEPAPAALAGARGGGSEPQLGAYMSERLIAAPAQPFAVAERRLVVSVRGTVRVRLEGLAAISGRVDLAGEVKRFRGRPTDQPFGEGPARLFRATGQGALLVEGRARRLTVLAVGAEAAYLREEALVGFEDGLAWENGRVPSAQGGGELNLVLLRGRGRLVLASAGEPAAVEVAAGVPLRVPLAALLGWTGTLTPQVLALLDVDDGSAELAVELTGDGRVLLDPAAAAPAGVVP